MCDIAHTVTSPLDSVEAAGCRDLMYVVWPERKPLEAEKKRVPFHSDTRWDSESNAEPVEVMPVSISESSETWEVDLGALREIGTSGKKSSHDQPNKVSRDQQDVCHLIGVCERYADPKYSIERNDSFSFLYLI